MYRFSVLLLVLCALFSSGCATDKLESRKHQRAAAYAALSAETKKLVDEGKIGVGMPEDAVYIAWGKPAQVLQAQNEGGGATIWLYEGAFLESTPYWAHYGTPMAYTPHGYVSAEVIFVKGLVKEWRTLARPAY